MGSVCVSGGCLIAGRAAREETTGRSDADAPRPSHAPRRTRQPARPRPVATALAACHLQSRPASSGGDADAPAATCGPPGRAESDVYKRRARWLSDAATEANRHRDDHAHRHTEPHGDHDPDRHEHRDGDSDGDSYRDRDRDAHADAHAVPEPEVVVENDTTYTNLSMRYVVGEVHNIGANDAYSARVTAPFFDGSGAFVALQESYAMRVSIAPDQRAPFVVLLLNAPQSITRYTLTVSAQPSTILDYRPITVVNQQVRDNSGPEVFGDIRNDQAVRVNNIRIVVTFYDGVGAVVHVDQGYLLEGLAAGAIGGYRIATFRSGLGYARYLVQAEGYTN